MKIQRLTESQLQQIVENSVRRVMEGRINTDLECKIAYQELHDISDKLTSLGLRTECTPYHKYFKKMMDAAVALNQALIKHNKRSGL